MPIIVNMQIVCRVRQRCKREGRSPVIHDAGRAPSLGGENSPDFVRVLRPVTGLERRTPIRLVVNVFESSRIGVRRSGYWAGPG